MKKIVIAMAFAIAACNSNDPHQQAARGHAKMLLQDLKDSHGVVAPKPTPQEIPITAANPQAAASTKQALDLYMNAHQDQALEIFRKAAALDPTCVTAETFIGLSTPGLAGTKLAEAAFAKGGALPEIEKDFLAVMVATRESDPVAFEAAAKKLVLAAPNSPIAHLAHSQSLAALQRLDDAIAEGQAALDLDPTLGISHNVLGGEYLAKGKPDEAIAHLKKYAELAPKEANAQDSLGEAFLSAGKFDEAEAAFVQATALDPKFTGAWQGVALSRLFRNDMKGAMESLAKAKAGETTEIGKLSLERTIALAQLAAGKGDDALKTLTAQEKAARAAKAPGMTIEATIDRAFVQDETGKHQDALRTLAPVADEIAKSEFSAATKNVFNAYRLNVEISAEAAQAKKADAARTLAATEALAKPEAANVDLQDALAFARGEEALARGDAKAAVAAFHACSALNDWCHYAEMRAAEKAGDKGAADSTRAALAKTWRRDGMSVLIHAKLGPAGKS